MSTRDLSEGERMKWLLLDEAGARHYLGSAYDLGHMLFPDKWWAELARLVREALLELHEEGLVFFFCANDEEGWSAKEGEVPKLARAQILEALDEVESGRDEGERTTFLDGTVAGGEVLRSLPEGIVPRVSGQVPPWKDGPRGALHGFEKI